MNRVSNIVPKPKKMSVGFYEAIIALMALNGAEIEKPKH